ncbi:uncharacterized protein BXZ73DRAFT_99489 [Epithele typhae]|uniref:uncharacterized protein n=1 Tax=Epithele typhae TaxID=378194 RepID=UPI0020082CA1|nr:uncharacterized protein BXZ73DRAFT_99489 [Epithele typhae]KAH9939285.1 hypothetical protein BXZ73DRAFT_99489 [Epithele typhae]
MAPSHARYWYIVNVDDRQMSHENLGVLGEWFFNDHRELFRSLHLPRLRWDLVAAQSQPPHARPQPAPLFRLPPELLALLFELLALPAAAALAATCRALLAVGAPHVARAVRTLFAPWAGRRVLCLGAGTARWDLPRGLLTARERAEFDRWAPGADSDSDDDGGGEDHGTELGPARPARNGGGGSTFPDFVCARYRLVFGWVWNLCQSDPADALLAAIARPPTPRARSKSQSKSKSRSRSTTPPSSLDGDEGGHASGSPGKKTKKKPKGHARTASAAARLVGSRDAKLFRALCDHANWSDAAADPVALLSSLGLPAPPTPPTPPTPPRARALANLTTAEVVHEAAFARAAAAATTLARSQVRVGWGHVLLARVCWCTDGRTGLGGHLDPSPQLAGARMRRAAEEGEEGKVPEERTLWRGAWAGHRFAIVAGDMLQELEREPGFGAAREGGRGTWRDVSAAVAAEVCAIWEGQGIEERDEEGLREPYEPWQIRFDLTQEGP